MTDYIHPDRNKCLEYLKNYKTPEHVIGHCKSVAAVAYRLGAAINSAGGTKALPADQIEFQLFKREDDSVRTYYRQKTSEEGENRMLDLNLVLAAGLLHDMARIEERHWDVCADFLLSEGYIEEAKLVRVHMMYEFTNDAEHITETDLLCLGDRLSLENRYAGLDERMEYIIRKAEKNGNMQARPRILAKKEQTRNLLNNIEKNIGCTVDELMINLDYESIEKNEF